MGTFKALVLKIENGKRDVLLSETAPSASEALQALHNRSAEAVQNYIGTNGFGLKKRQAADGHETDGYESTTTVSTVTLEECESLSDDETISVTSVGQAKRSSRRKANKSGKEKTASKHKQRQGRSRSRSPSFSATRVRSHSTSSSSSGSEINDNPPSRRYPVVIKVPQRQPPRPSQNGFSVPHHPLPPPSGIWNNGMTTGPGMMNMMNPAPPAPAPSHPAPFSLPFSYPNPPASSPLPLSPAPATLPGQHQHQQPLHDIVLSIRWRNSERRTLEQTPHISVRAIQAAALAFVRRQPVPLANLPAHDPLAPRMPLAGLKAVVKSVLVDGTAYDLTGYLGDDLTRLVESLASPGSAGGSVAKGGVPRFEVEVVNLGVPGGLPPQMRVPQIVSGGISQGGVGGIGGANGGIRLPLSMPPPPPPGVMRGHGQHRHAFDE